MTKTIIITSDFITLEQLTIYIRSTYRVVLEIDKAINETEIERTLKIWTN